MYYRLVLFLCFLLLVTSNQADAQYRLHLESVTDAQSNSPVIEFGKPIDIKIKYFLNKDQKVEEFIKYLNEFYLIINGSPLTQSKFGDMQFLSDVATNDSGWCFITYQTTMISTSERLGEMNNVSRFWKQQYRPFIPIVPIRVSFLSNSKNSGDLNSIDIYLKVYNQWRVIMFAILFGVILVFILTKATQYKFSFLRDEKSIECSDQDGQARYSLSRTQIFVWTFVIFGLLSYLWSVTGIIPDVHSSHLVLLGIAAGQRIISQVLDTQSGGVSKITIRDKVQNKCSVGLFIDLISDDTGISISRLQFLIATLVFLLIFIVNAFEKLELTVFTVEQLGLMGTSAGLYLWNKKLDQQK